MAQAKTPLRLKSSPEARRRRALQRELKRWLPLLIANLRPEKIILFGSLAEGRVGEWSDIDLVIVQKTSLPFLRRVRQALLILKPRVGADLLIYTPEEFARLSKGRRFIREEILGKGKVIYERQ